MYRSLLYPSSTESIRDLASSIAPVSFHQLVALPRMKIEVDCSGGFYIRSLIADLSIACNTVGHMTALVRLQQGPFRLEHALTEVDWNRERLIRHILHCNKVVNFGN